MRLLIVTTDWEKKIWNTLLKNNWDNITQCNCIKLFKYSDNRFNQLNQLQNKVEFINIDRIDFYTDGGKNVLVLVNQRTNENTKMAIEIKNEFQASEICIAQHRNGGKVDIDEFKGDLIGEFTHEEEDFIYKALVNLVGAIVQKKDIKIHELFSKFLRPLKIKEFSKIKNQIANLWLPLDIDLMGLKEVGGEAIHGENMQVKYLAEVLYESKKRELINGKSIYYRQRMVNLRYAITGNEHDSKLDGIPVRDDFKTLVNRSLKDIIPPEIREHQEWGIVNELAGLKEGKPKYIIEFIKKLDEKILKAENVDRSDVIDILDFFKRKNWKIEGANPENIKSFHDWFCALDDCMERLRKL